MSEHLVTPLGFEPRTPILKVSCSNQAELRGEKTHIIELTIDVGTETIFNTLLYPNELKWEIPTYWIRTNYLRLTRHRGIAVRFLFVKLKIE